MIVHKLVKSRLLLKLIVASILLVSFFLAFREGSKESIQLAKYDYSSQDHARCQSGSHLGTTGKSDHEQIASGIYFAVRTPLNYDNTIQHPLVIVYAPGGKNRFANERITGLTQEMTKRGFVVAYVDNQIFFTGPLTIPVINDLSTIPKAIAKKWCIDTEKIFLTGHSDGGTVTAAIGYLPKTKHIPHAIAPSAAGIRKKDLANFDCPDPISILVMQKENDTLFPNYSKELADWWATCNSCEKETTPLRKGCGEYLNCDKNVKTLFCETPGEHQEWSSMNNVMINFFIDYSEM